MIYGIYLTYYWHNNYWETLPISYDYNDTIYFELTWGPIYASDPFKLAISKVQFDYYTDNNINYQIEEQTTSGGEYSIFNCKFYPHGTDYTTYELSRYLTSRYFSLSVI